MQLKHMILHKSKLILLFTKKKKTLNSRFFFIINISIFILDILGKKCIQYYFIKYF